MAFSWREVPHPSPPSGSAGAYGSKDGLLYYIGGFYDGFFRSSVVRVFDPGTGTWGTVTALPTGMSANGRAAAVGDWLYFIADDTASTFNYRWWRYSVSTGVREQLTTPPSAGDGYNAVALGNGLIYLSSGDTMYVYDPDLDSWATAPGTSPSFGGPPRLASDGAVIVAINGFVENDTDLRLYDPSSTGTEWVEFSPPPLPMGVSSGDAVQPWIEVFEGRLYWLAAYDAADFSTVVGWSSLDLSNIGGGWSAWPPGYDPEFLSGALVAYGAMGEVPGGLVWFDANDHTSWIYGEGPAVAPAAISIARATATGKPTMQMAGRGRSTASASASGVATVEQGPGSSILAFVGVDYDFRTTQDSFLTGFVDIVGGTGQVETVLAFVTIPEKHVASFAAFVDVVLPVTPDIPPIPLAPEGNLSIVQPDIP